VGAVKRKSIHAALAAARAEDRRPITWIPTPAWAIGGDVDILTPDRGTDLSTITRPQYLAALERAGFQPEQHERSWARFVAYREGDHGLGCTCTPACIAKRPLPPAPRPTTLLIELDEYGLPRHPGDRATPETDRYEQEKHRLLAIARAAGDRWFTN